MRLGLYHPVSWQFCEGLQALDCHGIFSGGKLPGFSRSSRSQAHIAQTGRFHGKPNCDCLSRTPTRLGISTRSGQDTPRHQGRQCPLLIGWCGQTRRFWRGRPIIIAQVAASHICRYALLDGARSNPTGGIRQQSRYMVAGDHSYRNGQGRTATRRISSHASAIPHPESQSAEDRWQPIILRLY